MVIGLSVLASPEEDFDLESSMSSASLKREELHQPHRTRAAQRKMKRDGKHGGSQSLSQISPEESAFFSVADDDTVICWDEYDRAERYSFRLKEIGEVCMKLSP
jgi:hypothetical protein